MKTAAADEDGRTTGISWVSCDLCEKWRRLPRAVADSLGDGAWSCKNNPDPAFASCSVPQELTNEEIDALDDSEDELERTKRRKMPAVWQLLKENSMGHRKRKAQDEDDIMICHCPPTWRGGDGCGPNCINRMLCIECVPGFCPCEHMCTNQLFTKKQYAGLEVKRAGAKGFGLFATKPITAGQFVIEYIGEVLEEEEYLRRKEFYLEVGQRHYYFMNVGNGEVIDACRKGNISRFINHSCEPNCETQKWLVKGELAIGLFATKDIALHEELTFDYNFERYGDKPMKCYCGSKACRKFVGGVQDSYRQAAAAEDPAAVDNDTAINDIQPLMVQADEVDGAVRALLDWRVGAQGLDKARQASVLARLEKLCQSHNIEWRPSDVLSATEIAEYEQLLQQQQHQQSSTTQKRGGSKQNGVHGIAGRLQAAAAHHSTSASAAKQKAKAPPAVKAEVPTVSTAPAGAVTPATCAAASAPPHATVPEPSSNGTTAAVMVKCEAPTPEFRGPLKFAFKQQQAQLQPDGDMHSNPKSASTAPPPQPSSSGPSKATPAQPIRKRLKQGASAEPPAKKANTGTAASAAANVTNVSSNAAANHNRLLAAAAALLVTPAADSDPHPDPAVTPATSGTSSGHASAGKAADTADAISGKGVGDKHEVEDQGKDESMEVVDDDGSGVEGAEGAAASGPESGSDVAGATAVIEQLVDVAAQPATSSAAAAEKSSSRRQQHLEVGSAASTPVPPAAASASSARAGASSAAAARRSAAAAARTAAPPPSHGRKSSGLAGGPGGLGAKKLSEIDRRLEDMLGKSGGLRDPSRQNIIKVLRMFNLCDIGPPRASTRQPADHISSMRAASLHNTAATPLPHQQQQSQAHLQTPRSPLRPQPQPPASPRLQAPTSPVVQNQIPTSPAVSDVSADALQPHLKSGECNTQSGKLGAKGIVPSSGHHLGAKEADSCKACPGSPREEGECGTEDVDPPKEQEEGAEQSQHASARPVVHESGAQIPHLAAQDSEVDHSGNGSSTAPAATAQVAALAAAPGPSTSSSLNCPHTPASPALEEAGEVRPSLRSNWNGHPPHATAASADSGGVGGTYSRHLSSVDIAHYGGTSNAAAGSSSGGLPAPSIAAAHTAAASPPPPAPIGSSSRVKARLADFSLLLDVILKTTSPAVRRDFVTCGILTQFQSAIGRNFGKEYYIILRKLCRVVDTLPLSADDVHAARSAHGSFADVLRVLSTSPDFDVKTRAAGLLRKFPASAISENGLRAITAAARARGAALQHSGAIPVGQDGGLAGTSKPVAPPHVNGGSSRLSGGLPPPSISFATPWPASRSGAHAAHASSRYSSPLGGGGGGVTDGIGAGQHHAASLSQHAGQQPPRSSSIMSSSTNFTDASPGPHGTPAATPVGLPSGLPPRYAPGTARGTAPNAPPSRTTSGADAMARAADALTAPHTSLHPPAPPHHPQKRDRDRERESNEQDMDIDPAPGTDAPPKRRRRGFSDRPDQPEAKAAAEAATVAATPATLALPYPLSLAAPPTHPPHHPQPHSYWHSPHPPHSQLPPHLSPHLPPHHHHTGAIMYPHPPPGAPPPQPPHFHYANDSPSHRHLNPPYPPHVPYPGHPSPHAPPPQPPPPTVPPASSRPQPPPTPPYHPTAGVSPHPLPPDGVSTSLPATPGQNPDEPPHLRRIAAGDEKPPMPQPPPTAPAAGIVDMEIDTLDDHVLPPPCQALHQPGGITGSSLAAGAVGSSKPVATASAGMCLPSTALLNVVGPPAVSPVSDDELDPTHSRLSEPCRAAAAAGTQAVTAEMAHGYINGQVDMPRSPPSFRDVRSPVDDSGRAQSGMRPHDQPSASPPHPSAPPATATAATPLPSMPTASVPSTCASLPAAPNGHVPTEASPPGVVHPTKDISPGSMPSHGKGLSNITHGLPVRSNGLGHVSATQRPPVPSGHGKVGGVVAAQSAAAAATAAMFKGIGREAYDEWMRPMLADHADTWDDPSDGFQAYVADAVRHRLGKYMQPEHPSRISADDAAMLRGKIIREVVDKEQRAFESRAAAAAAEGGPGMAGLPRPIERRKVEGNLKDYVRQSVRRLLTGVSGGPPAGAGSAAAAVPSAGGKALKAAPPPAKAVAGVGAAMASGLGRAAAAGPGGLRPNAVLAAKVAPPRVA